MDTQTNTPQDPGKPRRPWRRIAIGTLLGGLVAGAGFTAFAHGGPFRGGPWGHGGWHMGPGAMDPESMQRRAEAMVRFWLADINATEDQQKRIAGIAIATMKELAPVREQHLAARKQAMDLLSKPQIDRAALEALRAQELQLADQVTRRMTQSIADAAEVLNPDQRAQLAAKMAERRGRWHRG